MRSGWQRFYSSRRAYLLHVAFDQALLVVVRDAFLDPLRRDADRQIGRVGHKVALGDSHLQVDLAARLGE